MSIYVIIERHSKMHDHSGHKHVNVWQILAFDSLGGPLRAHSARPQMIKLYYFETFVRTAALSYNGLNVPR